MNDLAIHHHPIAAPVQAGFFNLEGFELMQRVAKGFASSSLVPQQYQGNVANTMIALSMAQRIGADPMAVMQQLYIVHGRPSWSSKFLIATFNACGRFSAMRFRFKGDEGKDEWSCQAYAIEKATGEEVNGSWVSIAMAKAEGWYSKNGSKWKTMPQQMLIYRAASFMVNTVAPELSMGLVTAEEADDIIDVTPTVVAQPVSDLNARLAADSKPSEQPDPAASSDWPKPDANGELIDIRGCPWLDRYHSSNKSCNSDGTWRKARGVPPALVTDAEDKAIAARHPSAKAVDETAPFELTGELTEIEKGMSMVRDAKNDEDLDGIMDWSRDADLSDDDRTRLYCAIDEKRAV